MPIVRITTRRWKEKSQVCHLCDIVYIVSELSSRSGLCWPVSVSLLLFYLRQCWYTVIGRLHLPIVTQTVFILQDYKHERHALAAKLSVHLWVANMALRLLSVSDTYVYYSVSVCLMGHRCPKELTLTQSAHFETPSRLGLSIYSYGLWQKYWTNSDSVFDIFNTS